MPMAAEASADLRSTLCSLVEFGFDERIETVLVLLTVPDYCFDGQASVDREKCAIVLMVSGEACLVEGFCVGLNPGNGQRAILVVFEEDKVRRYGFLVSVTVAARRTALIAEGIPVAVRCAASVAYGILVAGLTAPFASGGKSRCHASLLCQAKFDSRSPVR
jgi:hypothetical protein